MGECPQECARVLKRTDVSSPAENTGQIERIRPELRLRPQSANSVSNEQFAVARNRNSAIYGVQNAHMWSLAKPVSVCGVGGNMDWICWFELSNNGHSGTSAEFGSPLAANCVQ